MPKEGSTNVALSTQRLSAMIDSLQREDVDEQLLRIAKPKTSEYPSQPEAINFTPPKVTQRSPSKLYRSPAGLVSLDSADNRTSMISDYSGVEMEGVGVSYIVQNQNKSKSNQDLPNLPALPSVETLKTFADVSDAKRISSGSDDLVVKAVANAKAVARMVSTSSKVSATSEYSERNPEAVGTAVESLRLLSINKRHMAPSSVGSGNLASESGSSYYNHARDEEAETFLLNNDETKSPVTKVSNPHSGSSDNISVATSIVPPLSTTVTGNQEGEKPSRSETSSFNPTIPPRNKNRPRSRLFIRDTLDEIEQQLREQMRDPIEEQEAPETVTRTSSTTNHSDAYFSATSYQDDDKDIHEILKDSNNSKDVEYLERPLPNVPSPLRRDSTIRIQESQVKSNGKEDSTVVLDEDEQYEDLDETEQQISDGSSNRTPVKGNPTHVSKSKSSNGKASHRKKTGKKKRQELRSFDIDTLSQLLNFTKGTLIGSEFTNLGMNIEEKRALERLVDSLSTLTADMVLDPDRYEEGLRRLDKATKALEGF